MSEMIEIEGLRIAAPLYDFVDAGHSGHGCRSEGILVGLRPSRP